MSLKTPVLGFLILSSLPCFGSTLPFSTCNSILLNDPEPEKSEHPQLGRSFLWDFDPARTSMLPKTSTLLDPEPGASELPATKGTSTLLDPEQDPSGDPIVPSSTLLDPEPSPQVKEPFFPGG